MPAAPTAPSPDIAQAITRFIRDAGYTEAQLKKYGLTKVPWRGSELRPLLHYKIPEGSSLDLLVRLFFFGETVPLEALPQQILEHMIACGMLHSEGPSAAPDCMLVPLDNLLLACDSVRAAQTGAVSDLVLGVNTPTKITANCLLPIPNADVLDLGTGCGTLALKTAPFARSITATDINARALAFTQFNAALNGIGNVQVHTGDRFEPVAHQSFDLIVSNPPFFLTPHPKLLYTDNPAELDGFVESLARTAPGFLNEGGFFQMLCEWVECKQQPWQSRLRQWFEHSGCDVLILRAYEIDPVDYTLKRAAESAALHGETSPETLRQHADYFRQKNVEKIFGGLVVLRRRTGPNWFLQEDMDDVPTEPIGELLLERFRTQDVLATTDIPDLLITKPCLSQGVQLVQEAVQQGQSWKAKRIYLERKTGMPRLAFDAAIAEFVGRLDGTQSLDDLITVLAKQNKWPRKEAVDNSLRLVRKLASLGLVTF